MFALESTILLPAAEFRSQLVEGLAGPGYVVFPELLRPEIAAEIRAEMERLRDAGAFRPAGVGRGESNRLAPATRGDGTCWFEPAALTAAQSKLGAVLEAAREGMNAKLFLGLWDWEGHYAIYPPGTFYRRHLDRFANDSRRTVSTVFFFNPEWTSADGGDLRMETSGGPRDVAPVSGTAVFFLSDRIPHEVLETRRERFSFAGWFRTRE